MVDLTLEGIGWTWSGPNSMVWDAADCSLTIAIENAQVPAGQDELRQDLEITFRKVAYFKVIRDYLEILNQIEIESLHEVDSLPSLGNLDTKIFEYVRAPEVMFGSEHAGESLGKIGTVRMFVLIAGGLMAEFTAHDYSVVPLEPRSP